MINSSRLDRLHEIDLFPRRWIKHKWMKMICEWILAIMTVRNFDSHVFHKPQDNTQHTGLWVSNHNGKRELMNRAMIKNCNHRGKSEIFNRFLWNHIVCLESERHNLHVGQGISRVQLRGYSWVMSHKQVRASSTICLEILKPNNVKWIGTWPNTQSIPTKQADHCQLSSQVASFGWQ